MGPDNLQRYAEMLRLRFSKDGVRNQLDDLGWSKARDGRMPPSNVWRRKAALIFSEDLVRFHFADGVLEAVAVDCRPFAPNAAKVTNCGWQDLRERVSKQLGQPGRGRILPADGDDWRCRWTSGSVAIDARAPMQQRRRMLRLTMHVPTVVSDSAAHSLEDLLVA